MRVLVGTWARLRSDAGVRELAETPATSGVFARFEPAGGGWRLSVLDRTGAAARTLGAGAGLVARHAAWLRAGDLARDRHRPRGGAPGGRPSGRRRPPTALRRGDGRRRAHPCPGGGRADEIADRVCAAPRAARERRRACRHRLPRGAGGGRLRLLEPDRARRGRERGGGRGIARRRSRRTCRRRPLGPDAGGAGDRRQRDRLAARRHDPAPRRRATRPRADRRQRRGAGGGRGPGPADRGRALCLRRALRLRRPRPDAAATAADRTPLGAHRDPDHPHGAACRRRSRAPARGAVAARPGRGAGWAGGAQPAAGRGFARPRGGHRRHARAAGLRTWGAPRGPRVGAARATAGGSRWRAR